MSREKEQVSKKRFITRIGKHIYDEIYSDNNIGVGKDQIDKRKFEEVV